ncbi:Alpha/beta hydrolase family-domain-containing protein [Dioszegia hungarica]|uniref:Alpha/beta hydrolase family-domain-containing protein n=1 Tax=Dioszegia hungarica TaxID=4972 RepID=A0AA38LS23_9TREE|nr:Alpha/beta hydrolase family-domain-containing protein [Dioszegia hungarica]KAI9632069.1 Alpha/beta hydrolase family-domain-containing protein [Dioszegia hungarica]
MSTQVQKAVGKNPSYARPPQPSSVVPVVPPPPYIPYTSPPTSSLPPPRLPDRPPIADVPAGWTRTSHIVPAAYPRRFNDSFGSLRRESKPFQLEPPKQGETKEERLARNEGEARECLRQRFDARGFENGAAGKGEGLFMAGERWRRDGASEGVEGVTLVVTHANGFHKESWHPTLRRLLEADAFDPSDTFGEPALRRTSASSSSSTKKTQVDEIWLFDDVHHAASIDLNADRIGGVHGWSDGGRDIVNFLQHVYGSEGEQYPDQEVLTWREGKATKRRKVIGVGHSVGGNALVQAAAEAPQLFHGIFLVEPMCPAHHPPRSTLKLDANFSKVWPLVNAAARRRSDWPTLDDAAKVRSSPFYASWHEETWALYLSHGFVPLPGQDGAVQLATPAWAEGCVFAEPTGIAEGWDRLAQLDVPVGFLMAGDSRSTQGDEATARMVWRPKLGSNERVMDGGHLLVQEKPDEVADALHRFIGGLSEGILTVRDVLSQAKM